MHEILVFNATQADGNKIREALGEQLVSIGEERVDGLPVFVNGYYGEAVEILNELGFETDEDESDNED